VSVRPTVSLRVAAALDLVATLVFVVIGLHAHHHRAYLSELLSVWSPFAVGLAVGWWLVRQRGLNPRRPRATAVIVTCCVAIGMIIRVIVGQGTAPAFIAVAFVFLSLFLFAWRGFVSKDE